MATVTVTREHVEPTQPLTPDQRFFFDHGTKSYYPAKETREQGYTRGAIELAAAEDLLMQAMRVSEVSVRWFDDPDGAQNLKRSREKFETCEGCAIVGPRGEYLADLYSITDADANYRRVIRAELASECVDQLRAIITTGD